MMKWLKLSCLIALHVSNAAITPSRKELALSEEHVKSKWRRIAEKFEDENRDVLLSRARQRLAFARALFEFSTKHRIDESTSDFSPKIFQSWNFPFSMQALKKIFQNASGVNPWLHVLEFLPYDSDPLLPALRSRINARYIPRDMPGEEALAAGFKRHLEKKKRAETWNSMSVEEKKKNFTDYVTQNKLKLSQPFEEGDHPLLKAVIDNNVTMVDVLLAIGADVDEKTPLFFASGIGHEKIVAQLINSGADVDRANEDGNTPLLIASQNGHVEVVARLIAAGADVNKANRRLKPPLFFASLYGNEKVVAQLIDAGADVNQSSWDLGLTPLYIASVRGHEGVVKLLLEAHADKDMRTTDSGQTSLYAASRNGHAEIVRLLLDADADVYQPDEHGNTPMSIAKDVKKGKNKEEKQPYRNIIKLLEVKQNLSKGLCKASKDGNDTKVKTLIDKGANVNQAIEGGDTPLSIASAYGHVGVVERLIASGAEVDQTSRDGETPLLIASRNSNVKVVLQLIAAGADVNKANLLGQSPLRIASEFYHVQVITDLLAAGADVNQASNDGLTPSTYIL